MANDGKIYIIVTNQLPNGTPEPVPGAGTDKKEKDSENTFEKFVQHKFFNLIESQAKQAVNYSINNIGNFTGDYVEQAHVSDTMQVLSMMNELTTSFIAGTKMTGTPLGGLVAIAVSGIGRGISSIEQQYAGYVENVRQNRSISQLRTRAGLNSANNGSRGTNQ